MIRLVPISFEQACEHVHAWHRHLEAPRGHKFSIGAADDEDVLRAVVIVGRPVSAEFDDGLTLEVTRLASDGTRNANSLLYGAAARAAFALGYRRVVTYNERAEGGASLRAAGYRVVAERPARAGWQSVTRPASPGYRSVPRQLWDVAV